jgi:hypothetical protein
MSKPEVDLDLASCGVRVTRQFERSRLEEELYEAVYESLLVESPLAPLAGRRERSVDTAVDRAREPLILKACVETVPA